MMPENLLHRRVSNLLRALLYTAFLWWVIYPTLSVPNGTLVDPVDGPFAYQPPCIDAARYYNQHGDGNSLHNQQMFTCRWLDGR